MSQDVSPGTLKGLMEDEKMLLTFSGMLGSSCRSGAVKEWC